MSDGSRNQLSLKQNVAANYFSQAYAAVMGFAFVPICITYLGTEAYGLIAIFAILQSSSALFDMGMKPALGREMARYSSGGRGAQSARDLLRSAEIIGLLVASAVALVIWRLSTLLATNWFNTTTLSPIALAHALTGMGVICALRFIENIYIGSIIGLQRQVVQSFLSCSLVTARAFGSVGVLSLISPTIEAFFIFQVFVSFVSIPVYALAVYQSLPPCRRSGRFSWPAVTGVWKFAGGVTMIMTLTILLTQSDKILLSRLLPLKIFSFYAVASVLSGALYTLSTPICAAFYPSFTTYLTRGDQDGLWRAYHQAAQLMAVVMGSAAIVLAIFADTALHAWTGDLTITTGATPLLRVLALGTLLNGLVGVPYQLQLASGWTSLTTRLNVVAASILVPALYLVIPRHGAMGAAWIWVLLNIGYMAFDVHLMHRRLLLTEKWRWYKQDVMKPIAAGTATAVVIHLAIPRPSSIGGEIGLLLSVLLIVMIASAAACGAMRVSLAEWVSATCERGSIGFRSKEAKPKHTPDGRLP
jgi:O-antigen/teichoic acid export membrane protein